MELHLIMFTPCMYLKSYYQRSLNVFKRLCRILLSDKCINFGTCNNEIQFAYFSSELMDRPYRSHAITSVQILHQIFVSVCLPVGYITTTARTSYLNYISTKRNQIKISWSRGCLCLLGQ